MAVCATYPPSGVFTALSLGVHHSCAIDGAGAISCWGNDDNGQVSDVPSGTFAQISSGGEHSCALDLAGAITCWGYDSEGQVTDTPTSP